MNLLGYSERGLQNVMCFDCRHSGNAEQHLGSILNQSCFPLMEEKPAFDGMSDVTVLIEQKLSQFGDADLIVIGEWNGDRKCVVFCEFKRGCKWTLQKEWKTFKEKITKKARKDLTSNLFCQLYFKQRFADELASDSCKKKKVELEFAEPLDIKRKKGDGCRKIGGNPVVMKATERVREAACEAYFLMITPHNLSDHELKHFLTEANEWDGINNWSMKRWGHLSLQKIREYCRGKEEFNDTMNVFEYNKLQLCD